MATDVLEPDVPRNLLRLLTAAPHRLLFLVGALNLLLAMGWWTVHLALLRWNPAAINTNVLPPGWIHSLVMQYQVLPAFMFGFLLTVFPRWMNQTPLTRRHYVPVGACIISGQLLTLASTIGAPGLLRTGALVTLLGWSLGSVLLWRLIYRDVARTAHAVSCGCALLFGLLGVLMYCIYLWHPDARLIFAAIKLGTVTVLLPIYFTVCHRMIPFFTGAVLPNYSGVRPMWALVAFWLGALTHVWLELRRADGWLWLPDAGLCLLTLWLLYRWWPRKQSIPPLLRVLYVGFSWLPLAFALYCAQSLWYGASGEPVLGRAPAHALFVGFFGSLLVAMVTRVTQGHSGRPLVLGKVAAFAFLTLQLVAVVRILAEVLPDQLAWQASAAFGWLIAFLPWVLRSSWIYLTPRIDGKQG